MAALQTITVTLAGTGSLAEPNATQYALEVMTSVKNILERKSDVTSLTAAVA